METFGLSSAAAGLISLGVTVCQGLLDYYRSWKDAEDQVAHMYASIEALTETFRLLESAIEPKVFNRASVKKVEESIISAESGLQSLRKKLEKIRLAPSQPGWKAKGMAQLRRTLFPFKESTLAKLKELGIELRQELKLALEVLQIECSAASLKSLDQLGHGLNKVSIGVDILQERSSSISGNVQRLAASSQNTSRSVDGLAATQRDEYCRKVYDWLSPLTVQFQKKHLDIFNTPGRQDAAAQSLLQTTEFKLWLGTPGEMLWCPGIQGTGKTIFASYVINHLQGIVNQTDTRLAYIYLSYKDAEKQSISNLLTAIVCQLAFSEPGLPPEFAASYEAHGAGAIRPSYAECTQLLRSTIRYCTKVFLIIDAFDEYPEEWRGQLVTELQRLKPRVNSLVTSRNLPVIERQLSGAVRLDVRARSDDILQYLRERIASSERLKSHAHKDPTLSNYISTTIATRSEGMFLQARLHLESLTTKTTLRKLKDALTALPEGLDKTYDETMERINSQHPDQATLARKVLCWVFHAFRPLTVLEIQHALAVETGDSMLDEDNIPEQELLLTVCNGLVTFEKEGGFLALVHYTFQQYLERKAENLFPEAQADIVRTCLTYLSFDEFGQGPCLEDQHLVDRHKRWPLLSYAVSKWNQHARQGAEEACIDLIISFLSQDAKLFISTRVPCVRSQMEVIFFWFRVSLGVRESMGVSHMGRLPPEVSALWLASFYGLEYTVSHLLASQRHRIDEKTGWRDTALHRAAACGNTGVLKLLLSNGAEITAKDRAGNTSLHLASSSRIDIFYFGRFDAREQRTWSRMEQNARTSETSLNVIRLLLDHGANVNAVNFHGESALHLSVKTSQKPSTQLLLARNADVILKCRNLKAPLTLAIINGDDEMTQILLEHDLQRQVQYGILDEAMRIAASKGQLSLLKLLLAKSPEQPAPDQEGRNLLHMSAYGGSLKCFQSIENSGFDLEAMDRRKRTCVHIAAAGTRPGSCAILEYLLGRGLDPSQSDVDGWTPLLWAAKAGNITNIGRLLEADAGRFYQGDREWIPFAIATYHGNSRAAEILRPPNRPLPELFETYQSSISLVHNYLCDGCELSIIGSRFKCSVCPNFDYCFKCVLSVEVTHPSHHFDFIYWDDRYKDVQKIDWQEVMKELTARETYMKSWTA